MYTRYTKVPPPPRRTIRKRSYKNFIEADFIKDVASLDFGDIYMCRDVDYAANLLTSKLLEVLNIHAPWIIFQERKHFTPWITLETLELMQERDSVKSEARSLSNLNSNDSQKLWEKYRKLRNKVNNRIKWEENNYKKEKIDKCNGCPSKFWSVAKGFMNWASSGPPSQLEVTKHNQITLCTKAADIAEYMNEYFISKVQNILSNLNEVSMNLNGCRKIMDGWQFFLCYTHHRARFFTVFPR